MKTPTLIVASLAIAIFGVSCSSTTGGNGRHYSHNSRLDSSPAAKPIVRKIYMPSKNRVTANPGKIVLAGS